MASACRRDRTGPDRAAGAEAAVGAAHGGCMAASMPYSCFLLSLGSTKRTARATNSFLVIECAGRRAERLSR